jgi:TPR repeat protein
MTALRYVLISLGLALSVAACSVGNYSNKIPGSYGSAFKRGSEARKAKDYAGAVEHYAFAAKSGHPRALVAYGKLYADGRGVERDPVRAVSLLEDAHGKNSSAKSRAALELGRLLLTGGDGPSGALAADPSRARALLIEALNGGEARAAGYLGRVYDQGIGVPPNAGEAISYYRQVADRNTTAATRLAQLLAENGAPDEQVEKAAQQAILRLETDASSGKRRAWVKLADIFTRGEIVDADPSRAIGYLENVVDDGDVAVYTRLARLYAKVGQQPERREMLRRAADAGNANAQATLAKLFLKAGTADTNGAVGRYYAERAIGQGSNAAMVHLGRALLRGDVLPQELQTGERLLRRASDNGDLRATAALGRSILKGEIAARYPDEGETLLNHAATEGSTAAMSTLGFAYHRGRGVPKDEALAREWLQKAADAGHERAKRFLAEQGQGA